MIEPAGRIPADPTRAFTFRHHGTQPACRPPCMHRFVAESGLPAELARRALQRPFFRSAAGTDVIARDIVDLVGLLESLRDRCFEHSYEDFLAGQGFPAEVVSLAAAGCVGGTSLHARADVLESAEDAKFIELNAGSGLGGLGVTSKINRHLLGVDAFASFARAHGLRYADTTRLAAEQLRREARATVGVDDPLVAIIEEDGSGATCARLAEDLAAVGLRVVLGEIGELCESNGKIVLRNDPVDVVFQYFFLEHLIDVPDAVDRITMLAKAHRDGNTVFFGSFDALPITGKSSLALLYEPEVWAELTAAERALVERRVPWTRLFGRNFPSAGGAERARLIDECRDRREEVVLKPSQGWGSTGTMFGANFGDAGWREVLESEWVHDYVVQQRVPPKVEPVVDPATGRAEEWQLNLGVYVFGDAYAGTLVRGLPADSRDPIGGEGTFTGCLFTY